MSDPALTLDYPPVRPLTAVADLHRMASGDLDGPPAVADVMRLARQLLAARGALRRLLPKHGPMVPTRPIVSAVSSLDSGGSCRWCHARKEWMKDAEPHRDGCEWVAASACLPEHQGLADAE